MAGSIRLSASIRPRSEPRAFLAGNRLLGHFEQLSAVRSFKLGVYARAPAVRTSNS